MVLFLLGAVVFLAFSNGANDNVKGVATLMGSRTANYRQALGWATVTTFAGSLASIFLAGGLLAAFSGKGIVEETLTDETAFLLTVGLAAATTVMLATLIGIPISTTHALTGALVGAGLIFSGAIHCGQLVQKFLVPLAVSPLLSCLLTTAVYPAFRYLRQRLGVERQMCLCVTDGAFHSVVPRPNGTAVFQATGKTLTTGELKKCQQQYSGQVFGFDSQKILDKFHFLSAGMVGFARGLNDTPKIVALLAAAAGLGVTPWLAMLIVAVTMAIGGLLKARKVADTMSEKITTMNHGQGFTANLITALLVTVASRFGVPVSTTHVSCGSLFGLGAVTGGARWKMIGQILLAWIITLPVGAGIAVLVAWAVPGKPYLPI